MFWLIVIITILVIAIWQYLSARNDIFKRIDIKGPTPTLLFGNLSELRAKTSFEVFREWTKKYGKVYGYFEGGTPILVTSDPDILFEVFVKQFSNFHGRKVMPWQGNPDTAKDVDMFSSRGQRWKRLRNISNPTFTSLKLKQMFPLIMECADELISVLTEKCNLDKPFNIYPIYQGYAVDVIARTALGYESSVQKDPKDVLLNVCQRITGGGANFVTVFFMVLSILLPELKSITIPMLNFCGKLSEDCFIVCINRIKKVVEERRKLKNNSTAKDFIQLMLDAETSEDFEALSRDETKKLTTDEVVAQCFLLLIAGYETTSTTLAFASYLLAMNPGVQEKIHDEIHEHLNEENITYEDIHKLKYLDTVIQETLRMYPVGQPGTNRLCMKSATINGVYIPEGLVVTADVGTLHFNPDIWGPDVNKFNPNRFSESNSTKRHPMVYCPFGAGPRICIGMRFSLIEIKLALCKIVGKFKIQISTKTQIPLKLQQPALSIAPKNGVVLNLELR